MELRELKMGIATAAVAALMAGCAPAGIDADPPAEQSTSQPPATQDSPSPAESPSTSASTGQTSAPASTQAPADPDPSSTGGDVNDPAEGVLVDPSEQASASASASKAPEAVPAATVAAWMDNPKAAPAKYVFLTFDDGPNDVRTPEVLDVLKEKGVKATFFLLGSSIPSAPAVLKREHEMGMGICLHSQTHNYKKLYPGRTADTQRVVKEWDDALASTRAVLGADFKTGCWRYPGGHMSWKKLEAADKALAAKGATWLDWDSMTGDAEPASRRPGSRSEMVSMATAPIRDGRKVTVMLAHDAPDKKLTVQSLPAIIDAYKEAGYTFGIIS